MTKPPSYLRKTVRLPGYDYATPGSYFVTVCAHNRCCIFGTIENGIVNLSPIGEIIESCWRDLPNHYLQVSLDASVVMPNHFHGILCLNHTRSIAELIPNENVQVVDRRDTASCVSTGIRTLGGLQAGSLSEIIRSFKSGVTKGIHDRWLQRGRLWQPGYYEHVIRTSDSLQQIRNYILSNPQQWSADRENPSCSPR
jgi:REP element-mobilizing transposase RayT